jgi:hypothetical protein
MIIPVSEDLFLATAVVIKAFAGDFHPGRYW